MIAFRRFTKRYGATVAAAAIDLEVRPGEVVALLGPNGSGKTTSLKGAAGLIRPTSGEALVGDPLRAAMLPHARRACSYLPQKVTFPDALTGREVVQFYRALRGVAASRVDEVLQVVSLNGAASRAVGGYSGGMVQRLGLAVAILPDAPVLLLDEPTAALDPEGLAAFYALVQQRKDAGQSVLFSSHQLGDVERLADRIAVLIDGRLAGLFAQRELAQRLADRGVMRVRLSGWPAEVEPRIRAIAPGSKWLAGSGELLVPGAATVRPAVLHALRDAGMEIGALSTEEGRLDGFYRDLMEEHR